MRLLVLTFSMSVFLLTACEIEPSKSEKEAIELKKLAEKAKSTNDSPDPANPKNIEQSLLLGETRRAEILAERGDLEGAVDNLDLALKANPKDRLALRMLSRATQKRAQETKRPESSPYFLQSADAARRLIGDNPKLSPEEAAYFPVVFYNAACTHAVSGEPEPALKALAEAVEVGFRDLNQLETDPELESIRGRSEFNALIRKVEEALIDGGLAAKYYFKLRFDLPDSEGKSVKSDDFKDNLLLVVFWGSTYAASRKEIPHLIDLDKRFRDKHLRVVGINIEPDDAGNAKATVASFVKENQIPFPCLVGDEATRKQVIDFKGFPTILFIGPDGKVRLKLNGYQTLSSLELATTKLLDELAKPKTK